MKLIDKSALVAEINRRIKEHHSGYLVCLKDILSLLDTFEVKEVDLKKYYIDFLQREWHGKPGNRTISEMMAFTAKHFFELGLRVNNPITAADRGTAEEIIINLKRVEEDYRINLTKEIEWLKNQVKKRKV